VVGPDRRWAKTVEKRCMAIFRQGKTAVDRTRFLDDVAKASLGGRQREDRMKRRRGSR